MIIYLPFLDERGSFVKNRLKFLFAFETIATATMYGLFAYFIIYGMFANGRPLVAYIYNIFFIIAMLLMDMLANHYLSKEDFVEANHSKLHNFFSKLLFFSHFVSFKTSLYLFYVVMLVVSRISILETDIINPYLRTFIYSVEYGVLLLVPLDKFIDLLIRDDKRVLTILSRLNKKRIKDERSEV